MRILFAAPDRDLLECYKEILERDLGETVTAFDGTQVLTLISRECFDVAILDRALPRVGYKTLVTRLREKNIPVVLLTDEAVGVSQLTEKVLPGAYLAYPFDPAKLSGVITDVIEKSVSDFSLNVGGAVIAVSGFGIKDGPGLTAGEIDVLRRLSDGDKVTGADGAYVGALNAKIAQTGSGARIRYRTAEGFELVS